MNKSIGQKIALTCTRYTDSCS